MYRLIPSYACSFFFSTRRHLKEILAMLLVWHRQASFTNGTSRSSRQSLCVTVQWLYSWISWASAIGFYESQKMMMMRKPLNGLDWITDEMLCWKTSASSTMAKDLIENGMPNTVVLSLVRKVSECAKVRVIRSLADSDIWIEKCERTRRSGRNVVTI